MDRHRFAQLFPLGAHLCREPMPPMAELKRDMETLKAHGFNLIKLQEHWAYDEPTEGRFDFGRYEELIEYAARLDLGVYLGLTCEQAPPWLWRKHPDCRMVGRNGLPIAYEAQMTLPADGKPGPCFDHDGARADMVHFIRELVRVLGRFENVVVWNTWQEIAYWPERLAGQHVCYCEHTLAHFRRWLMTKYGDLDGLNCAWNTRYGDWYYVGPDRSAVGREVLPQDVDWFTFMDNVQIGEILRVRAQAIRDADPLGRPVFAHKGGPVIGSGMDWTYARCQDFLGSSCYPAWSPFQRWDDGRPAPGRSFDKTTALRAEMWNGVALTYDAIRSCSVQGRPVWAAEFQGGPVSTDLHKGRVPSPADIRRWMLTASASGVTALSFWVARAEISGAEMNGFSLLDSEGDSTPRLEEAARIGRALAAHATLFGQPTAPRAEVGILVNEETYQVCQSLRQGGEHYAYAVRGWHRLLWDLGVPVDFVEASQLEGAFGMGYRALVLPFPLAMSEAVAMRLTRYVEQGGQLISEACPGRLNGHAYANRGELSPTLRELFGVRQLGLTLVREPDDPGRWLPAERTWGEYADPAWLEGTGLLDGVRLRAAFYIEELEPLDAEPCLRYEERVVGVQRQVGAGRAWLLGTLVGHSGTAFRASETHAAVEALLRECSIGPGHAGELLLRRRVTPTQEAWFYTNPTDHAVAETVSVAGWDGVKDLLGSALPRSGERVTLTVDPLDVRVLIVSRSSSTVQLS